MALPDGIKDFFFSVFIVIIFNTGVRGYHTGRFECFQTFEHFTLVYTHQQHGYWLNSGLVELSA